MKWTRTELVYRIQRALEYREEVLEAYLFGSSARGQTGPISDIDVAVYVDEDRAPRTIFGLDAELSALLMSTLGTNAVDLVLLNRASPLLYHRVLRDGVRLLSRDARATTRREGEALSRYCDYVPQLAKIEAALAHRREETNG